VPLRRVARCRCGGEQRTRRWVHAAELSVGVGAREPVADSHRRGGKCERCERRWHHAAARTSELGHDRIVATLIDAGAAVNVRTADGTTPLYLASQNGHERAVSALITAGAEVNRCMANVVTALFFASQGGHAGIVTMLLEEGADVHAAMADGAVADDGTIGDSAGITALWVAAQEGHADVAQLLITAGADVGKAQTIDNMTPLMMAARSGGFGGGAAGAAAGAVVVDVLVAVGADVNARDAEGDTALSFARAIRRYPSLSISAVTLIWCRSFARLEPLRRRRRRRRGRRRSPCRWFGGGGLHPTPPFRPPTIAAASKHPATFASHADECSDASNQPIHATKQRPDAPNPPLEKPTATERNVYAAAGGAQNIAKQFD
jgi:hypothetical protein